MMIDSNLRLVEKRIKAACERSGRDSSEVTLISDSRYFPWG